MKAKILFVAIAAMGLFASCGDGKATISPDDVNYDPDKLPVMTFETTDFNFGTITEGEHVKHVFKFKNTGKGNLIITEAKPACGCTVAEKPDEPIPPGGESEIVVDFNSEGKSMGATEVKKSVIVTANTIPNKVGLLVHGFVKKAGE